MNSGTTYEGQTIQLTADIDLEGSETNQWIPIGYSNDTNDIIYPFGGTFDGNGHRITGLYINTTSRYQGLFGYNNGTIKNLGIVDGSVTGYVFVGGVVGWNGGTVENSYNTGSVSGNINVGGVVGENYDSVENCYYLKITEGTVTINSSINGIGNDSGEAFELSADEFKKHRKFHGLGFHRLPIHMDNEQFSE